MEARKPPPGVGRRSAAARLELIAQDRRRRVDEEERAQEISLHHGLEIAGEVVATGPDRSQFPKIFTRANQTPASTATAPPATNATNVMARAPIYGRKTRAAAIAAPKPLSMLHTVTPAAQLFSMVSSAARPWKLAP